MNSWHFAERLLKLKGLTISEKSAGEKSTNFRFLQLKNKALGKFRFAKTQWDQRKIYRFYTCPSCKQKIRVPRGHGKISITCPKCRTSFIGKS